MGGLPDDTRFLHIGPFKTGTTAIQGAFHLSRDRLKEHRLTYIGEGRQPAGAAQQAVGQPAMFGSVHRRDDYWERLVEEVDAQDDLRPIISSEFFSEADDAAARRIVDDLGGSRVHVVVTLRSLSKILSAQWQQFVQSGLVHSHEEWLEAVFTLPPEEQPIPTFWRRHDYGALVARWSSIVGPENMTVIAVDDSDPDMLLRSFAEILDLPAGFLAPDETQANRSLSFGEAEFLRRFNREFLAQDWDRRLYRRYIRFGAAWDMKIEHRPSREDAVIRTPQWAMERAAKVSAESAEAVTALVPRTMGDFGTLGEIPPNRVARLPVPRPSRPKRRPTPCSAPSPQRVDRSRPPGSRPTPRRGKRPSPRRGKRRRPPRRPGSATPTGCRT